MIKEYGVGYGTLTNEQALGLVLELNSTIVLSPVDIAAAPAVGRLPELDPSTQSVSCQFTALMLPLTLFN